MKKNLFSLGVLAAAAIALAGCAKTESNVPEVKGTGISFEFIATSAMTKTTNDDVATDWEAGDQVNLFHAVAGETEYVNDNAFTASEAGPEVKFTGELTESLDASNSYDWYAFYPYTKQVETPANTSKGYVTLGSGAKSSQTQNGNSSMEHIAGKNYPIAGMAACVAADETPSIAMVHLSSLIEVMVNNTTANPITVTDITFVGTEDIVGTYYVDFASEDAIDGAVFTPSGNTYVSNTAKLTVEDGTPIAAATAGSTTYPHAYFYLAVKPFTAKSGEKLTLKVTTDEYGTQEVEKTLTADAVFEGGHENFFTFNYTKADAVKPVEIASLKFGDEAMSEGQVTAFSTKGFILSDNTGSIFVYTNKDDSSTLKLDQFVSVSGTVGQFNKGLQFTNATVTAGDEGSYAYPDPTIFTETEVNTYIADTENRLATYVTLTGTLKKGTYDDIIVGSGTATNVTLYSPLASVMQGVEDGDIVTVKGYAINVTGGKCGVIPMHFAVKMVPKITWGDIDMVEADGVTDATLALTPSRVDGWDVDIAADGTVVTDASINSACDELTYTVSENTGTQKRAGTITVTFSRTGEEDVTYTITISQKANNAGGTEVILNIGSYANANSWENGIAYSPITIDANVSLSVNLDGNNGKYYTSNSSWRAYEGNSASISLTAASGKTLKSVEFSYASGNNGVIVYNSTQYASGETIPLSGSSATFSVTHSSGSSKGNVQIQSVTVVYN